MIGTMEDQARIFRKQPFGWFDKPIMRHLREKYGKDKKTFIALRATYLAICEMESDFVNSPITAFNKTVGTYAGLSREAAGKYVKMLEREGLIQKQRLINPETNLKGKGTLIRIISAQEFEKVKVLNGAEQEEKVVNMTTSRASGYPSIRTSEHSDTPTILKKISTRKKVSIYKNVKKKNVEEKENEDGERIDYYAGLIADKFGDRKSLSYYKLACRHYAPERLYQKAQEIVTDGGAKNPAAVFVAWLKEGRAKVASQTAQKARRDDRAEEVGNVASSP
jgi:hypothetical protein